MGYYDNIKTAIDVKVNTNGRQAITGHILNNILHGMLNAVSVEFTDVHDVLEDITDYIAIDKERYAQLAKSITDLSDKDAQLAKSISDLSESVGLRFQSQSLINQDVSKRLADIGVTLTMHGDEISVLEQTGNAINKRLDTIVAQMTALSLLISNMNGRIRILEVKVDALIADDGTELPSNIIGMAVIGTAMIGGTALKTAVVGDGTVGYDIIG